MQLNASKYSDFEVITLLKGAYDVNCDDSNDLAWCKLIEVLAANLSCGLARNLAYHVTVAKNAEELRMACLTYGYNYDQTLASCRKMLQGLIAGE